MSVHEAQKEMDRQDKVNAMYCSRCAALRPAVRGGKIEHAVNCPLVVALRDSSAPAVETLEPR